MPSIPIKNANQPKIYNMPVGGTGLGGCGIASVSSAYEKGWVGGTGLGG
ncbi:MAG: hypothetical protein OEZ20_00695 [candidate division WOR-3 bacterium]|nr:hypothetical protein [candidate division WOR-3 bacterium]